MRELNNLFMALCGVIFVISATACASSQASNQPGADRVAIKAEEPQPVVMETLPPGEQPPVVTEEEATAAMSVNDAQPSRSSQGTLSYTSNPRGRGHTINVLAGEMVSLTVKNSSGEPMTVEGQPDGAEVTEGATSRLEWQTDESDVDGSPYRVSFNAADGGHLAVEISVLQVK